MKTRLFRDKFRECLNDNFVEERAIEPEHHVDFIHNREFTLTTENYCVKFGIRCTSTNCLKT